MKNTSNKLRAVALPGLGMPVAENHPKFPSNADPFTQSAWRIGWEQGHGLRKAPKGIKYGLENVYRLGLQIATEDRHIERKPHPIRTGHTNTMTPPTLNTNGRTDLFSAPVVTEDGIQILAQKRLPRTDRRPLCDVPPPERQTVLERWSLRNAILGARDTYRALKRFKRINSQKRRKAVDSKA